MFQIGIDEVGKGALYGRVYAASAVLLPETEEVEWKSQLKDSKKFASKPKLYKLAKTIVADPYVVYSIQCEEAEVIDRQGIQVALFRAIHASVVSVLRQLVVRFPSVLFNENNVHIIMDGNYFKPFFNAEILDEFPWINGAVRTEIKGDAKFPCISAASIIAKEARDMYMMSLPNELEEKYSLHSSKGYGTKKHLDGLMKYGPDVGGQHRITFLGRIVNE